MIIVDGFDKTGKTTLINSLTKTFSKLKSFRFSKEELKKVKSNDWLGSVAASFAIKQQHQLTLVTELVERGYLENLVIDRFLASEWSYCDPNDTRDLAYIWELDERLSKLSNVFFIFLDTSNKWVSKKLDLQERKQISRYQRENCLSRFRRYYSLSAIKRLKIYAPDYEDEREQMFDIVIKELQDNKII